MTSILIEGWRFTPNSFATVNQFQCLELMRRDGLKIFHKDVPYWNPSWKPTCNLLDAAAEDKLRSIPEPEPGQVCDATLRMGVPFDFSPSVSRRTTVFATCEFGFVSEQAMSGDISLKNDPASTVKIITPSMWSRGGLINTGADPEKIAVIPHGVDPGIFYPLPPQDRKALRKKLGWEGKFVFLNVSAMTSNKGIPSLLKVLGLVAQSHPNVRLVLKGLDTWYNSNKHIEEMASHYSTADMESLRKHVAYIGGTLSFTEVAAYYQAADAYVAPYSGEGFNLPVLEAIACGLPVICTSGGPTDDFTSKECSLAIRSELKKALNRQKIEEHFLVPDSAHLLELMLQAVEDDEWMRRARQAGPELALSKHTWKHVVDQLLPVVLR
jgi:glycosyltransferase involved in cell wall biosynthesis